VRSCMRAKHAGFGHIVSVTRGSQGMGFRNKQIIKGLSTSHDWGWWKGKRLENSSSMKLVEMLVNFIRYNSDRMRIIQV